LRGGPDMRTGWAADEPRGDVDGDEYVEAEALSCVMGAGAGSGGAGAVEAVERVASAGLVVVVAAASPATLEKWTSLRSMISLALFLATSTILCVPAGTLSISSTLFSSRIVPFNVSSRK